MIKKCSAQPGGCSLESDVREPGLIFHRININRRQLALDAVVGGCAGNKGRSQFRKLGGHKELGWGSTSPLWASVQPCMRWGAGSEDNALSLVCSTLTFISVCPPTIYCVVFGDESLSGWRLAPSSDMDSLPSSTAPSFEAQL